MEISDKIAELCFEKYNKLGKSGKPLDHKEWTLLSAVLFDVDGKLEVVSLATGTKCIGSQAMRSDGTIVNDSHAEVLARRAFIRYIFNEIKTVKSGGTSIVIESFGQKKYRVKDGVNWHMYTSWVPCGDASIIPMKECVEPGPKRLKLDIYRTGAKPVVGEDPRKPGMEYHIRGQVRVKPGRGDPTNSLSCSDKMARWIYMGIQGALLSHLLEKSIKLSTIVIGAGGPFDQNVIYNSLILRANVKEDVPKILQASSTFSSSVINVKDGKPSSCSIIWSNVPEKPLEVAIEGRRLGTTKKNSMKGMLTICKREFLKSFLFIYEGGLKNRPYREIKDLAESYQQCSKEFKRNMGCWSEKPPGLENFTI